MAFEDQYTPQNQRSVYMTILIIIAAVIGVALVVFVIAHYLIPRIEKLGTTTTQITASFQPLAALPTLSPTAAPTATVAPTAAATILPAPPSAAATHAPAVVATGNNPLPKTGPEDSLFYSLGAAILAMAGLRYSFLKKRYQQAARSITLLS